MKKILSLIIVALFILNIMPVVYASDNGNIECSAISFVDVNGVAIDSNYSSGKIIAKADVKNNTQGTIKPVMLVCLYKSGVLENVWYDDATQIITGQTGTVKTEFTPPALSNLQTIKATVLDNLTDINSFYETATLFDNSVNLDGILIDGKEIDSYSDNIDFYTVNCKTKDAKITPLLKDGGTKITTVMPQSIPGVAKIDIESPLGTKRTISLALYEKEEQLFSLQSFDYYIGNDKYSLDVFDPDIADYTVTLPDNTFYVKVEPFSIFNNGETITVDTYVQDFNHQGNAFGTDMVVYHQGSSGNDYKATFVKRTAKNNLIPIKNEESYAVVDVKYGSNKRTYTIAFKSKQISIIYIKILFMNSIILTQATFLC